MDTSAGKCWDGYKRDTLWEGACSRRQWVRPTVLTEKTHSRASLAPTKAGCVAREDCRSQLVGEGALGLPPQFAREHVRSHQTSNWLSILWAGACSRWARYIRHISGCQVANREQAPSYNSCCCATARRLDAEGSPTGRSARSRVNWRRGIPRHPSPHHASAPACSAMYAG